MSKKSKSKKKPWVRKRHKAIRNILYVFLTPYTKLRYKIKIDRFKEQEKRPYLILLNHQTPFDQFFVSIAFKDPVYYLATEDIFSNGFVSSLIKYLVAPIPIKKQTTDVKAILNCIRVVREGGTLCIAPEGNRTYSGRTEYMSPSIAPMARKLGIPIALFRIEGGYGAQPRWSDVIRKGKMHAYVSKVITPEEYAGLSDDELFSIIEKGLYVDEVNADNKFYHKKRAEYLERAIYVCPFCGLSTFESYKDTLTCKKCNRQITYDTTTEISGVGYDHPYRFVAEWYDAQKSFINSLNVLEYDTEPLYTERAELYEVIPCERKIPISKEASVALYGTRIEITANKETSVFKFEDTSAVTVLGRNKLNIYHEQKIYQLKGGKRFNALKYVHIYNRHKNIIKGDENVEFLGL